MPPTKRTQLAEKLQRSERCFKKACQQIVLLNDRVCSATKRYRMAQASGCRSFRYTLRLKMAIIEGLRNAYYEYATIKFLEMQQARREVGIPDEHSSDADDVTASDSDDVTVQ
jgi:hypothetical protein